MLTPEQLQDIGETLLPQLDSLNTWISNDMVRRFLTRFGRGEDVLLTGTDQWQAWVLQQSGDQLEAVQKRIAQETRKSRREIARIFREAGITALENDVQAAGQMFLLQMSPALMAIIEDAYHRTNGDLHNLTRTTAGLANQTFVSALDDAYWKVRTGAQSYTAAVTEAVERLSEVQADVRYPSGHVDHLEVATLRAVRTGTAQSSGNCTLALCREWGWNHVLVSAHLGARVSEDHPIADHAGWQGKVYSIEGGTEKYPNLREATGYPVDPLGLCGYNCRHSFSPFLPGVSDNPYDDKRIDIEENRKAYELSQKQRHMERAIRARKRKVSALKTAVDNCADPKAKTSLQARYEQHAAKLQRQNTAYREFCAEHDLKQYHDRLKVQGWGRKEAAQASAAVRAAEQRKIAVFDEKYLASSPAELLRNHEYANGIEQKLLNYSLNTQHIRGKDKALVFQSALGYNADNHELLVQQILAGLKKYKAKAGSVTEHGEKFSVKMLVTGANGRKAGVQTAWIFDPGSDAPRMTTAYVDD